MPHVDIQSLLVKGALGRHYSSIFYVDILPLLAYLPLGPIHLATADLYTKSNSQRCAYWNTRAALVSHYTPPTFLPLSSVTIIWTPQYRKYTRDSDPQLENHSNISKMVLRSKKGKQKGIHPGVGHQYIPLYMPRSCRRFPAHFKVYKK